ncbi:MAG TPA: hypothetical protein VGN07_20385 [Steroidobacteraceae bacterium]
MNASRVFLPIGVLVALAACGSDPEATAPVAATQHAPAKPAAGPEDPTARMARAVGGGKPGAAVDIKYEFLARPEVGKPIEVQVVLIPSAGVDAMDATFSGMDGITLAGNLSVSFTGVKSGEPYKHTISLLPDRNGVFYVTVAVNTQIGGATLGRTFSIPFVVGDGQGQQKPAVAPAKDATGQAVQPMKAQETTKPAGK